MNFRQLHPWTVDTRAARALQERLAGRIREQDPGPLRVVAGADMAIVDKHTGIAAVVVLSFPELAVLEQVVVTAPLEMPYIPGLLSFREIPVLLAAFAQVRRVPDLVFVDGQGRLHPRRLGLACHLGLVLDVPTIGCAKSLLCGAHDQPGCVKGASAPVRDGDEVIGAALRTRDDTRPIYVSVGHRVTLARACELVLAVSPRYRIPEPTRQADHLAGVEKRRLLAP